MQLSFLQNFMQSLTKLITQFPNATVRGRTITQYSWAAFLDSEDELSRNTQLMDAASTTNSLQISLKLSLTSSRGRTLMKYPKWRAWMTQYPMIGRLGENEIEITAHAVRASLLNTNTKGKKFPHEFLVVFRPSNTGSKILLFHFPAKWKQHNVKIKQVIMKTTVRPPTEIHLDVERYPSLWSHS